MKRRNFAIAAAVAAALGVTTLIATQAGAHRTGFTGGWDMMGHGSQMMGHGKGFGPCGQGHAALDEPLSVADVTRYLERHLAWMGSDRLKVGEVTETDSDTIVGSVVTTDGSLVWKFAFDRKTGRMTGVN